MLPFVTIDCLGKTILSVQDHGVIILMVKMPRARRTLWTSSRFTAVALLILLTVTSALFVPAPLFFSPSHAAAESDFASDHCHPDAPSKTTPSCAMHAPSLTAPTLSALGPDPIWSLAFGIPLAEAATGLTTAADPPPPRDILSA